MSCTEQKYFFLKSYYLYFYYLVPENVNLISLPYDNPSALRDK